MCAKVQYTVEYRGMLDIYIYYHQGKMLVDISGQCQASFYMCYKRVGRVHVLNRPACSADVSPNESNWLIMRRRVRQWRPQNVEQLKVLCPNILPAKLQHLVSSVSK